MNKSIIDTLYDGDISAFGRHFVPSPEHTRVNRKIEEEQRYFTSKMSIDDCQRFEALTNLYAQANLFEDRDSFGYGLRLGILLMNEIFLPESSSPLKSK